MVYLVLSSPTLSKRLGFARDMTERFRAIDAAFAMPTIAKTAYHIWGARLCVHTLNADCTVYPAQQARNRRSCSDA